LLHQTAVHVHDHNHVRVNDHEKAMECGAILDACSISGLINAIVLKKRLNLIERIISILTKMTNFDVVSRDIPWTVT
jgi:hypothetical protein